MIRTSTSVSFAGSSSSGEVHADDCHDPEAHPCVVDHIDRTLTLDRALTREQRARLVALAERCPVHRTLTGEIRVTTRLA